MGFLMFQVEKIPVYGIYFLKVWDWGMANLLILQYLNSENWTYVEAAKLKQ